MQLNKEEIFYYEPLITRSLQIIKDFRKFNIIQPDKIYITASFKTEKIENLQNNTRPYQAINLPYLWGGIDDYRWVKCEFKNLKSTKIYYGDFNLGIASAGLTVGSETLFYLNGQEYAGVDINHQEIKLGKISPNSTFDFYAWSGVADATRLEELKTLQRSYKLGELHQIKKLEIFELDDKINNLYYNVKTMLEIYQVLKTTDTRHGSLLINDLYKSLKYVTEAITREELYLINDKLQKIIDKYQKKEYFTFKALGQTHIDLAWLWRLKHTREKAARSFSTMLRLLENNPEFIFLQSQPQLFAYLKNDYPQIYESIKQAQQQGRLEIDGAMWLEADCNIPSGESLTRQILYGKKFIKEEFNTESKILWMPDVFGYSAALPQILKKSNVDVFCTTKMQWNQVNKMPFQTFNWKGLDGSMIPTHLVENIDFMSVNAKSLLKGLDTYKDKDFTNELLYQYGFGDGGGGPTQNDLELIKRYDKIPGVPHIKHEKATTYFKNLVKKINTSETYVHTWHGDMYLELHRGTFTSQAQTKKNNRQIEYLLRSLEMLYVKSYQDNKFIPEVQDKINDIWHRFLLNQFHDIIPGSSINEVYLDADKAYIKIKKDIQELEEQILSKYQTISNSFIFFNDFNRPITKKIFYKTSKDNLHFYLQNKLLRSISVKEGYEVLLEDLQPLTFNEITFVKGKHEFKQPLVRATIDKFENEYYKIEFINGLQIKKLYDKVLKKDLVIKNNIFNKLVVYDDNPLAWDAWDIDIFYKTNAQMINQVISKKIIQNNLLTTIYEVKYQCLNSIIIQQLIINHNTKNLDFKTKVKWNDSHKLLRVLFETDIQTTEASFDMQYGNIKRPTHNNTSWDMQKFEVVGHKWADLSNNSYGISLLNNCKYGYSIAGNILGLSLIKAATFPDPQQDLTEHQFTYSLYPHAKDCLNSKIEKTAHILNMPNKIYHYKLNDKPLLNLTEPNLVVDCIKMAEAEQNIIFRVHDWQNKEVNLNLSKDVEVINLLENKVQESKNIVKPYEIKTYKIKNKFPKEEKWKII
ncbi:MAG: alpha-mannosidase [Mycoplasmatales bacterium]